MPHPKHGQLRAFHNVARLGGFSRAADALGLTQPAISDQVRKLEMEQDVLLFNRDRRQVTLTSDGEALFALTKRYFEAENQVAQHLSQSSTAVTGELRIVADAAHHVSDILGKFRRKYPQVLIRVRGGNTSSILTDLRKYDAEIGVAGGLAPLADMDSYELGHSDIVAFASAILLPDSVTSLMLNDLNRWPLILREEMSKTRQKLEQAARGAGVTLTPALIASGREAVRELVATGVGIGFVSRAEYVEDPRMRLILLENRTITMGESLIHLTQRRNVRLIRSFMDIAQNG